MNSTFIGIILFGALSASLVMSLPNYPRGVRQAQVASRQTVDADEPLGLTSNSTSIRANIVDTFSCAGKSYGYYADLDNDCQVFHVCLPVSFLDGTEKMFKWSFICPQETIFNQESFTCARAEDSPSCHDAPTFYKLNENFGKIPQSKAI